MPRAKKTDSKSDGPVVPIEIDEPEEEEEMFEEPEEDDFRGPSLQDRGFGGGEQFGFRQERGRSVEVPLWNRANNAPRTSRLRVQYVEIDGNATECGHLPHDASLDTLIKKWPKSGTFLITPIDQMNRPMSMDPIKFTVSEDHDILRAVKGSNGMTANGVPAFAAPQMPPEVWEFLRVQQQNAEKQLKMLQSQNEQIRSEMRDKDDQVSKERMALAVNNTTAALDVQQQLIARDQERQDKIQQQQAQYWENMSSSADQRHQMALERMKTDATNQQALMQQNQQMMLQMLQSSASSDRQRMEDDRERLRIAREEERRWEADRRREEREEQNRREQERWESQRREQERQQQYHEKQIEMLRLQNETSDPFKSIEKLLEKGSGVVDLVKALGVDKLIGGGGGATGFLGVASETIGKALEGYMEIAKIQAASGAPAVPASNQIEQQAEQQYQVTMPDGSQAVMTESELEAYQAQVAAYQQQQQQALQAQSASPPAEVPQESPEPQGDVVPFNPFADSISKLDPKVQKSSRKIIRETIEILKKAEEEKYEAIITAQVSKTPEVLTYFEASSVAYAMNEGGADAQMVTKIISKLKEMKIVPDSIRIS
jgi:hypothetical protein